MLLALAGLAFGLDIAIFAALRRNRDISATLANPRRDWTNPAYAPPALLPATPHAYKPAPHTPACALCGGGELHSVHAASADTAGSGGEDLTAVAGDRPGGLLPGGVLPGGFTPPAEV